MCKTKLLEHIIVLVAQETELSTSVILSKSRRPEIFDARYIAVAIMLKKGIRVNRVAEFMSMTERSIYHVSERFDERKTYGDPMIDHYYNNVLKALK